ncbi:MAG: iron ABC transporter permease [Leptolyngbya sp. DLM2.Bin15]|nr:MAG: iron ABC transporter permease [Leptolyngbya sp. DLM2.Bin15]
MKYIEQPQITDLSKRIGSPPSHYRALIVGVLIIIGLLLVVSLSLTQGAVSIQRADLWYALLRQGNPTYQTVVWDLRLPRVVAAMLVGASLGMSGGLLQGMLRNDLADPFLLGISSGAGLVSVALFTLGMFQSWVPLAAWLGAIATTIVVYRLARTGGTLSVERLILGGVAVSALLGAVQSFLLLTAEDGRLQAALNWLSGSLNGRGWREVTMAGPYIIGALIGGCLLARTVNLLNLGDDFAVGLGISLNRSRYLIGAVATLLAAGAVSICGLVGFIGLIVPHAVRLLVGTDYRFVLPLSAVGGAFILSLADLAARMGSVELPVGIITALLGAPLFIWLLHYQSSLREG